MGFPGGGYEEQDASIRKTAERECLEEMGIDLVENATFLGGLRRLSHPKITVDAFVYHLRSACAGSANEEVADVLDFLLHDLNDEQFKGTIDHTFQNTPRQFPAITSSQCSCTDLGNLSWFYQSSPSHLESSNHDHFISSF